LIELASLLLACAALGGWIGWSAGASALGARAHDPLGLPSLDTPSSPEELTRHSQRRLVTTALCALGGVLVGVVELAIVLG
jgi:hypothetical protein